MYIFCLSILNDGDVEDDDEVRIKCFVFYCFHNCFIFRVFNTFVPPFTKDIVFLWSARLTKNNILTHIDLTLLSWHENYSQVQFRNSRFIF